MVNALLRDEQIHELRAAFSLFDKDNDGIVTMIEFENMVRIMFSDCPTSAIRDMLHTIDPKKKGQIDFEAFVKAVGHKMKEFDTEVEIRKAFRVFDLDGDGFITAKELRLVMAQCGDRLTEDDVHKMMKLVDKNGDGAIEYSEFLAILTRK